MQTRPAIPIVGYLGMLVAMALAAAFVATLAIVIWLPPRPPDVMPADAVAEMFVDGYEYMREEGRLLPDSGMVWSVRSTAPEGQDEPHMMATRALLAAKLRVASDRVVVAADHVRRNDVFVFRIQDVEELHQEAADAAREALSDTMMESREAERAMREAELEMRHAQRDLQVADDPEIRAVAEEIARDAQAGWDQAREEAENARAAHRAAMAAVARLHGEHRVGAQVRQEQGQSGHSIELSIRSAAPPEPPAAPELPAAPEPPEPVDPREPPAPPEPPLFAPAPPGVALLSGFRVAAELPDGRWLLMRQGRNWDEIGWIARAAAIIGGTLLALSLIAMFIARRMAQPIQNFSAAVQAVGVNPQNEPVREEGPTELRGAARAVNAMQARLRVLIADRTKTLAAVAHDMRTPLMRLRLALETAPEDQRARMVKDIGEVEALVASFIAFARDDPAEEARVRLDLSSLLQSLADDHASASRAVSFEGPDRVIVTGQSLGLKRLFSNLIDNALKYGAAARLNVRLDGAWAVVDVGDDGPGVPAAQREAVFEPFVRLSDGPSGAGLGLAAARAIARAHGGDIEILDAERGAVLRVTLPM